MAHQLKIYLVHNNKRNALLFMSKFHYRKYLYEGSLAIFQAINRFSCAKNMNIEQSCLEDFEIHYRNGNRNNDTRFYHNPYTNNNII